MIIIFLLLLLSEAEGKPFISYPLRLATTDSSSHVLAKRHSDRINSGRLLTGSSETVPIFGDFRKLAYFYADLFVGSTSQKFSVIADTGSSLTAVPCKTCTDCGTHQNPKYDPASSASATKVSCSVGTCPGIGRCDTDNQCGYSMSYAEGSSLNGKLWRDNVYLGGTEAGGSPAALSFPFVLGCGQHEGGLFTSQDADGIMGLGQADENSAIMRAMWKSGVLSKNIFSLCLSFSGGALTVGDVDSRLHYTHAKTPRMMMMKKTTTTTTSTTTTRRMLTGEDVASSVTMVPTLTRWAQMTIPGFYEVSVVSVSMDKSTVSIPHDGFVSPRTILDSGTTFTYIPRPAYDALRKAIDSYCTVDSLARCVGQTASVSNEPLCYRIGEPSDLETFPSFTIELRGHDNGPNVILTIPPQNLFVNMGWDNGAHCLSVYDNGNNGGVIGANAMMGNDVTFDLSNSSPRVGFAESAECQVYVPPPPPTSTATSTATSSASSTATSTFVPPLPSNTSVATDPSPSLSPNATAIPNVTVVLTATATSSMSYIPSSLPPTRSPLLSQSQSLLPSSSSSVVRPTSSTRSSPSHTSAAGAVGRGGGGGGDSSFDSASPLDGGSVSIDSSSLLTIVIVSVVAGMIACFLLAVCCATLRTRISIAGLVITRQSAAAGYAKVGGRKTTPGEGVVLDGGAKISDDDDEEEEEDENKVDEEERVNLVVQQQRKDGSIQPSRSTLNSKVSSSSSSSSSSIVRGAKPSSSLTISSRKPIVDEEEEDDGWGDEMMEDLDDDFNNQGGVSGNDKGTYKDKPVVTSLPHPALAATNNATSTTTTNSSSTNSTTSKPSSKMTLGKKPSSNSISVSINK